MKDIITEKELLINTLNDKINKLEIKFDVINNKLIQNEKELYDNKNITYDKIEDIIKENKNNLDKEIQDIRKCYDEKVQEINNCSEIRNKIKIKNIQSTILVFYL